MKKKYKLIRGNKTLIYLEDNLIIRDPDALEEGFTAGYSNDLFSREILTMNYEGLADNEGKIRLDKGDSIQIIIKLKKAK